MKCIKNIWSDLEIENTAAILFFDRFICRKWCVEARASRVTWQLLSFTYRALKFKLIHIFGFLYSIFGDLSIFRVFFFNFICNEWNSTRQIGKWGETKNTFFKFTIFTVFHPISFFLWLWDMVKHMTVIHWHIALNATKF